MPGSRIDEIMNMLARAPEGTRWVVIICDTFDHSDYPSYFTETQVAECWAAINSAKAGENMKKVMEVYDLKSFSLETQLAEPRAFHPPEVNHPFQLKSEILKTVETFSGAMLAKMEANMGKGSWKGASDFTLVLRLIEEVGELAKAIERKESIESIRSETVDVANFAMMIFDNTKV